MASWPAAYSLYPNREDTLRWEIANRPMGGNASPLGSDVYTVYSVLYFFFTEVIIKGYRDTEEGFWIMYTVYSRTFILGFCRT